MNIEQLTSSWVTKLTPYLPGKPISELQRELGLTHIVKLASNENPLGSSPFALEAVRQMLNELHLYPDGAGFDLKQALALKLDVSIDQITLGNGSNEILELIARAFLSHECSAVFSEHAFAVYPIVCQAVGTHSKISPAKDYGHDLDAMIDLIDASVRVVFIANPNNPTGTWLNRSSLRHFLENLPQTAIAVIDEAYFEYVDEADYPNCITWLNDFPNLIVTRTFSKVYGLAGLRVGYAVSNPEIADMLNRVRQPFNVNSLAMKAASCALIDVEFLNRSIKANRLGLTQLVDGFKTRNLAYIPSVGNFICLDLGKPAQAVYDALLREGVIVRPIANYGLPNHLRITIGSETENQFFLDALDRVLIR